MRLKTIKKTIVDFGYNDGQVATLLELGGVLASASKTLNKVLEINEPIIVVQGDLENNSDIIEVIQGLSTSGRFTTIVNTDIGDEISSLLRYKNIIISLSIIVPEQGVETDLKLENLGYLREKDELRFPINTLKDYDKYLDFKRNKNISQPKNILEVKKELKENFESRLFKEITSMKNVYIKYI